ncbi:VWA domain-containing protein [Clostridium diolis]
MRVAHNYLNMKNRTIKLIKKKGFKLLSIILAISLISTMIFFKNVRSMATIPDKPGFTISNISFDPSEPEVGEDITVSGRITPTDFEIPVPPKEIVLVLDVSGSMDGEQGKISVKCTNQRTEYEVPKSKVYTGYYGDLYTYINYTSFRVIKKNNHYYIEDYCNEHNKVGEHNYNSTKIAELKKAANNFVDRMKSVPNLKIGIVAYSSKAWINPNGKNGNESTKSIDLNNSHEVPKYESVSSDLLDITDSRLPNMINNLEALGGTNTGEGLRKAAYMLRNENTANKTIVLMSDGLPTFYSVKGSNDRSYYTTIDNTNPYYAGNGSDDNSNEDCLKYAKTIGGLIETKDYNIFSIGYGLDSSGNTKLSQIHQSMGGTLPVDNQEENEKTYFETDNGAIDAVFQNIATQIINNYDIKGGILTSRMLDTFGLALGGQTVSIPDINYKKDDANSTASTIRYHAEPYTFTFKIKASKAGDYSNIFKDSYISFPWNNGTFSTAMPNCSIKVVDNKLPNIEANLKEKNPIVSLGQDVTVTYEIKANSFQYKDDSSQLLPKDVVMLFDTSVGMKDKIGQFINGSFNDLLNNVQLKNTHTKYSIITFNSVATICDPTKYQNFRPDSNYDTTNLKTDTTAINDYVVKNLKSSESTDRNIGLALQKADGVLSEDTGKVNKYILLISSGSVTYTPNDIKALKEKGYIIISLAIGTQNSSQNPQTFLYDVHKDLAGEVSASSSASGGNYFISPGTDNNNDIANSIMSNIAKKIIDIGDRQSYAFDDVYLNFEMGESFKDIQGLESIGNSKYRVKIPKVVYNYDKNTNQYIADPINDISFKFKPGGTSLLFGNLHTITYTGITGGIDKNISVPTITVKSGEVKHGVYKGIAEDTKVPNIEDPRGPFPKGSAVTFGAYIDGVMNNNKITLKFDYGNDPNTKPIIDSSKIKVFQIDDLNGLKEVSNPDNEINENGEYTYTTPSDFPESGAKILILYTEVLSKNANTDTKYTNILKGPGIPDANATITVGSDLPDLF